MAEDSTRRLLKVFGVAVTDCEDALAALTTALADRGSGGAGVEAALDTYAAAARTLAARWSEVGRLVWDYHVRAQEAVSAHLRARGAT
jgi:hypothetical protein